MKENLRDNYYKIPSKLDDLQGYNDNYHSILNSKCFLINIIDFYRISNSSNTLLGL
jgi:hypothetical protein